MKNPVNILHLSDLHFGIKSKEKKVEETAKVQRDNVINALGQFVENRKDWKPDVVVISGDIGYQGQQKDYEEAKTWIEELLTTLKLTTNELILCAGNHDLDREKAKNIPTPKEVEDTITAIKSLKNGSLTSSIIPSPLPSDKANYYANEFLDVKNLSIISQPFEDYISFCDKFEKDGKKIPKFSFGNDLNYLVGKREVCGLNFIVLNSAWFSRGDKDYGELWIGEEQVKTLLEIKGDVIKHLNDEPIRIAVLHHPPECLNENERYTFTNKSPIYDYYLKDRCHFILSGHMHCRTYNLVRFPFLFVGGATHTKDTYGDNFSILQVDTEKREVKRLTFEYTGKKWRTVQCSRPYSLKLKIGIHKADPSPPQIDGENELLAQLCEITQKHDSGKLQKEDWDKIIKLFDEKSNPKLVNVRDGNDFIPLHYAAAYLKDKIKDVNEKFIRQIFELLSNGADIDAMNKDGHTPLHTAAYWGNKEVVKLLLDKWACYNQLDNYGRTPLFYADSLGHKGTADLLRQNGAI